MASMSPPPDPLPVNDELVAMLQVYLEGVKAGVITEAMIWFKCADGDTSYDFLCTDIPEMLFDIGTMTLKERIALAKKGGVPS